LINLKYTAVGIHSIDKCPTHLIKVLGDEKYLVEWLAEIFHEKEIDYVFEYFKGWSNDEILKYIFNNKSLRLECRKK